VRNNLAKIRASEGMSLQDLANVCGVTKNAIHRLEHEQNNPKLTTAYALANIFQMSVYDIFPDDTKIVEKTITVRRVVKESEHEGHSLLPKLR